MSNLSFMSKTLERIVARQLHQYLSRNHLAKFQSAYQSVFHYIGIYITFMIISFLLVLVHHPRTSTPQLDMSSQGI